MPAHCPRPTTSPLPGFQLRQGLARGALASLLLILAGCEQVAAVLSLPLLPTATPAASSVPLAPGQSQSVEVNVCPPQHYTTDLGYIFTAGAVVHVATGPLPAGVQARWSRERFDADQFALPPRCVAAQLELTAAADADLSLAQTIELRAWSATTDNQVHASVLTLQAYTAPPPPPPPSCGVHDIGSWQPQGAGSLPYTPGTALDDAQLARAGARLLAAWTERTASTLALRAVAWDGSAWRTVAPAPVNPANEAEIEGLVLLGAAAPAVTEPEAWLVYAASSFQGVGIANPMRLVARRLASRPGFELAAEPIPAGSPQLLRAGRSRDGLHVAVVQRDGARLQLWHLRPDAPNPAWTELALPDGLATAIVRSLAMALDADGSQLMALNRLDLDPIAGRWVERVQVWRLAVGGEPGRMEPAAPDQELQRSLFLPYGSSDLALLAGPDGASAATPQALVAAWTAADASPGHRVVAFDGSTRTWAPLGRWAAHAEASGMGNYSVHRQLFAGCGGAPTLAWSDFGVYPNYHAWAARAVPDAPNGWLNLGAAPAQGDGALFSGHRISMVWDGIDGQPLALVMRSALNDFAGTDLALRRLRPVPP